MQNFCGLMFFISLLLLIIGLFSPKTVIRWGNKKTRAEVFLVYGIATFIFLILIGITAPKTESQTAPTGAATTQPAE